MKRIIRVFPRRTKATPTDALAVIGRGPELYDEADEVHVSVAFTWDIPLAEKLAREWKAVAPVQIGGPALGLPGGAFTPGMYMKRPYVVTSRGCPNACWFCQVWRREGRVVRELPIQDGTNICDDNLLACSEQHIRSVFAMLRRQKGRREFTGGLEARLLQPWHVAELRSLHPKQLFFAYDTPDDYPPLMRAGEMLLAGGFTTASHTLRCYVLCGYCGDTIGDAVAQRPWRTVGGVCRGAVSKTLGASGDHPHSAPTQPTNGGGIGLTPFQRGRKSAPRKQ